MPRLVRGLRPAGAGAHGGAAGAHGPTGAQRDSDANRNVLASRDSALSQLSSLALQIGANLISQFKPEYIPRAFCTTLPRLVGGPDFEDS